MRPNFLMIGAPKAATTAICHHLGQHPDVFISHPKEPFFFCYDQVWAKGWDWYESLFNGAEGHTAIGEGTTVYANAATYPNALPRIAEHLPDAKIIYAVREPLARIQSYWMELNSQGIVTLPFNRAVRDDEQLIDTSRYHAQLQGYRQHFPDDRIHVVFYEEFSRDADAVLSGIFEFLGVDPSVKIQGADTPRYTSDNKRSDLALTNVLRKRLPGFFKLRDMAPKGLRETAKKLLKRPIPGKPDWDPDTLAWTRQQLADDTAAFLAAVGKPADYWDTKPKPANGNDTPADPPDRSAAA
ncbi:MAG: sulfotransferase [Planctomycetota bacterium]